MHRAVIVLALFLAVGPAFGAEVGQKVGEVPLQTFDDRPQIMKNFGERRATVVLFLSARSDSTEGAVEAINELNTKFRLREVLLVGVFPHPGETGEEIRRFAQHRGFVFPVFRDPQGKAARQFGVFSTPAACLVDKEGILVYRGAIGRKVEEQGVGRAVTALLVGQAIEPGPAADGTPIEKGAPARQVEDRFKTIWYSAEAIFEKIPWAPAHHASTIAEAANGDLLAVWYGGSYESADDETLFLSRRKKGQRTWSTPQALVRDSLQPPGNAVVFRDGRNRIWIVWGRMEASRPLRRGAGWGGCRLMSRVSTDHGVTWSKDQVFQDVIGWLPRNVPITLKSGELLLPMSGRVEGQSGSFFLRTADNGKTWQRSSVIVGGGQPTAVQREDGSLLTLMRRGPRIMQSESQDGGVSWSPAVATELKNPNSGIAMTRLRNGHLVLVFNNTETARTPLHIARSLDEGKTWEEPLMLESNPGEYSYPSVIQGSDGEIHITYTYRRYTIKHVEIDEAWIERVRRPN